MNPLIQAIEDRITQNDDSDTDPRAQALVDSYLQELKQLAIAEEQRIVKELEKTQADAWSVVKNKKNLPASDKVWISYNEGAYNGISAAIWIVKNED